MKSVITASIVLAIVGILTVAPRLRAQSAADTMVVAAMPPGNLNNVIMGDTTATGQRVDTNRVYVLQQTGTVDTVYYFNATIYPKFNLTIIGKTNPTTGAPPIIAPFVLPDNSTPVNIIQVLSGNVTLKGLYFLGSRADGQLGQTQQAVMTRGPNTRVIIDHCVFDNFEHGTCVYLQAAHGSLFCTNCEFRDVQSALYNYGGAFWCLGSQPTDTLVWRNDTFYCVAVNPTGGPGYYGYIVFDHNTVFFDTGVPVNHSQIWNGTITNNIFYGCNAYGTTATQRSANPRFEGNNLIALDSLGSAASPPYNITEAMRNVVVKNNVYCWPQALYNYWKVLSDTASAGNKVSGPVFINDYTMHFFTNKTVWPNLVVANNDSVNPGFTRASMEDTTLSLFVQFMNLDRTVGTAGSLRWEAAPTTPLNVITQIPTGWKGWNDGYPVPEDLTYSESGSLVDSLGYSVGDLNWYPSQYALWKEGKINAVEPGPQLPTKFDLSQNYPNPFNPTTNIKVSLKQGGVMSLKIYNVLGQLVKVVDQGRKSAGVYDYNIKMDNYASGIYFYTLQEGSNVLTRKMLLLK